MSIIGAYVEVCRNLTAEQFCVHSPHPFLLHSAKDGPLLPTKATRGVTVDRLVLGDAYGNRGPGTHAKEEAYTILPLLPRDSKDRRITLGCSKTCDVQINDESISALHAVVERVGETYRIKDHGSAAGTQVNSELVEERHPRELASGDRVTLGYVDLVFLPPADFYRFVRGFFGM